jgi:hypothetical protein
MRRIVWTFGIIGGLIVAALFAITFQVGEGMSYESKMLVGYTSMVIALSTVFLGIKTYRDKHLNGTISFGKAFMVGLYITLIASALYVIGWKVYSHFYFPDYTEKFMADSTAEFMKTKPTAEQIADFNKDMEFWKWIFGNPILEALAIFLLEIFPVGVIITLISSAILKTSKKIAHPELSSHHTS